LGNCFFLKDNKHPCAAGSIQAGNGVVTDGACVIPEDTEAPVGGRADGSDDIGADSQAAPAPPLLRSSGDAGAGLEGSVVNASPLTAPAPLDPQGGAGAPSLGSLCAVPSFAAADPLDDLDALSATMTVSDHEDDDGDFGMDFMHSQCSADVKTDPPSFSWLADTSSMADTEGVFSMIIGVGGDL